VIQQVFALPLVTRLAVGPDWANLSPEQQKAVIVAFTRFTIANYAYNFRDFDGQKFEIDDNVLTRGTDKIVRTRLIPAHDTPVNLLYRMHEVNGTWKIVDVYSDGSVNSPCAGRTSPQRSPLEGLPSDSPSEPVQRPSHEVVSRSRSSRSPAISAGWKSSAEASVQTREIISSLPMLAVPGWLEAQRQPKPVAVRAR